MAGSRAPDGSPKLDVQQKLMDVLEITRALTTEVNLDALLQKIIDGATRLLEVERSTLYLIDKERGQLVSRIAQLSEIKEIRLPLGAGLAGHVAVTGEVLIIPDAYRDPRFDPSFDLQSGFHTRDLLIVPVRNSRFEQIGVIQVLNRRDGLFSSEDVALLEALAASAGVAVENARLYQRIEDMLQSFVRTLAASIDARDPATAGHSVRVAGYAAKLARELGVGAQPEKLIYLAGLLHDYGKIGVPEAILTKAMRLTGGEMEIMRRHASMSHDILANVAFTEDLGRIPDIVYEHHERVDGSGYPRGLRREEISWEGRVLAVCDVFDALTSRRPYRDPIAHAEAFAYIARHQGSHFDPEAAEAFGSILRREGGLTELHVVEPTAGHQAAEADRLAGRL